MTIEKTEIHQWLEGHRLPCRVINPILNDSINTLDELTSRTSTELMRLPNFGRKSLSLLRDALMVDGRWLADENPLIRKQELEGRVNAARRQYENALQNLIAFSEMETRLLEEAIARYSALIE